MNVRLRTLLVLAVLALVVVACSRAPAAPPAWSSAPAPPTADARLLVEVHRSPTCSCCHKWEAYMRSHGFGVRPVETADMAAMKQSMGVPQEVWSCHTAVIDGYIVEGHVPIDAIEDLLRERPPIDGIALPGMPEGSPGMGGVKAGPLEILAVNGGKVSLFGSY